MRTHFKLLALIVAVFSPAAFSAETTDSENRWTFNDDIYVPSLLDPSDPNSEEIGLPANIFIPNSDDPNATFPAIIFISSWALNEHEYAPQAENFANKGYVVLSYTARGFYGSGDDLINTAGERDHYDVSAAIDYLIDSGAPIDINAIGLSGISYGAGISLLGAFNDERVKAVAAMSAWGDLVESLWAGNTPNKTWIDILVASSQPIPFLIDNNPNPEVDQNYANMKNHENVPETKAWGAIRSPITYVDQVNARENKPALFIANNMHDYLFQPDSLFRMLHLYEGQWRLMLNRGTHASGEAGGLLGNDEHEVWQSVHLWFDYHLMGIENGISENKPFNTKVLNTRNRESYDSLNPEDEVRVFNLIADSGALYHGLSTSQSNLADLDITFETDDFIGYTGHVPGALDHTSRKIDMAEFKPTKGLAFVSPVLTEDLHLRGEAKVDIQIVAQDKAQYFGYLFYLNPETGVANWVTHAPFSCHQSEGCAVNEGEVETITLDFYWTAVDLPAGSQVLLIIDGHDPDYWRYETTPLSNTVVFSADQNSTLSMPIVWESPEYDNPVQSAEADTSRSANGDAAGSDGDGLGGSLPLPLLASFGLLLFIRKRFS